MVQATPSELRIPGWLTAPVGRHASAIVGAAQVVLTGAALTDFLISLVGNLRAAAVRREKETSGIEERLREFEDSWEQTTGERLSTAAFYDRFCAGEFDTLFGARWATYYEATLNRPARRDGLSHLGLQRPAHG